MNAISRRYVEPTMVLQTTFDTPTGNRHGHRHPGNRVVLRPASARRQGTGLLIRSVLCERSSVDFDMRFSPRPQYGLITPLVLVVPGGP